MFKIILSLLFIVTFGWTTTPEPFHELYAEVQVESKHIKDASQSPYFAAYSNESENIAACLQILERLKTSEPKHYLKQLRRCQKKIKAYDKHYVMLLRQAIKKDERALFALLMKLNPKVLQKDGFVTQSMHYYERFKDEEKIAEAELLLRAFNEEEAYREAAMAEMQNYESAVEVLSYDLAKHSRDKNGKKRTFFIGYKKHKTQTVLIAENENAYPVSVVVTLKNMKNYIPDKSIPYAVEIAPYSKRNIMYLRIKSRGKKASVSWSYSWTMGRFSAQHDASYHYGLPFKKGALVIVSQGHGGKSTHTGRSQYAVDFVADEGTPIYAARGGKVIATESSHDQGGFDVSFGKYANYITIEHTDHTLGQYYHLQQGGVKVNIGQYVSKGQFIGLSGNTGYSSGPHLHFGVYKVDPSNHKTSITLPFSFVTNKGIVSSPKKGDMFRVVR